MKTLVFVPCYNEAENVTPLVTSLSALDIDADVLFCDDNSPDGTGTVLDALTARFPRLHVMRRPGKLGVGSAHLDGIRYAIDRGYTHLVTMDCDFTHAPEDIPRLLAASRQADIVTASRFQAADSLPGWTVHRRALTHLGHLVTGALLGMPHDATSAFRVYRLDRINPQVFELITEMGYAFFLQSLFIASQNGLVIKEVSTVLPARTYGHSKMSATEVRKSVTRILQLAVQRQIEPSTLRIHEEVKLEPSLSEHEDEWEDYWTSKGAPSSLAYGAAASLYRNLFIKRNLRRVMLREFSRGDRVLHAGCGSGQVDRGLSQQFSITAVDLSPAALRRYRAENPDVADVQQADITRLPFPDGTFDGAYNLGVIEHFDAAELVVVLKELRRVTRTGGKVVIFWPHRFATSAFVLDSIHFVARNVLKRELTLHPPEPSRLTGRPFAEGVLRDAGLRLLRYEFGPNDLFIQAVVVGEVP